LGVCHGIPFPTREDKEELTDPVELDLDLGGEGLWNSRRIEHAEPDIPILLGLAGLYCARLSVQRMQSPI
jgi:hypothetical protein